MGVEDRHSKRTAVLDRAKLAKLSIGAADGEPSGAGGPSASTGASGPNDEATAPLPAAHVPDPPAKAARGTEEVPLPDGELDDPFTAWDVDDEGARHAGRRTKILRKPLVLPDPVAMRSIVLSRSRTLEDPLTTRMLAELSRADVRSGAAHDAHDHHGSESDIRARFGTPADPDQIITDNEVCARIVPKKEAPDPVLLPGRQRTTRRSFLPLKEEDLPPKK